MKKLSSVFFIIASSMILTLTAVSQSCSSSVCNAASANQSDVLAALPSSGNTNSSVVVNIPSGAATWNSSFSYSVPSAVKSLTIQGKTSVTCSGTAGTSGYSCSASDATVINDNVTNASTPLWRIDTSNASTLFRITGITLQPASSSVTAKSQGIVQFSGTTKNFRWDHSHVVVSDNDNAGPEFDGQIEGVIDHNLVELGSSSSYTNGFRIYNDLLDTTGLGDGGWMASTQFGSQHALFLEANYVTGGYTTDCANAGREVLRYNTFSSSQDSSGAIHSTKDPEGPARGCRSLEFYKNYMSGGNVVFSNTGGEAATLLNWGNTVGNLSASFYWSGGTWRSESAQLSKEPSGKNPPNGWGMCGSAWDGNSDSTGYPCLDGVGRGQQQDKMNGANFPYRTNTAAGTQAWPHQYLEPAYLFANKLPGGMSGEIQIQDSSAQANRDVYFDCNAYNPQCSGGFTGSKGTGSGPLASRPSTCSAGPGGTYGTSPTGSYGVAYWATDANSGNGELYVCDSTNHWTGIYQPYTYPHPLISGTTTTQAAPPAPTGLVSTVY